MRRWWETRTFLRNLSYLTPISEIAVIYCLTKVPKGQMAFPMNHLSKMLPPDGPVALKKKKKKSKGNGESDPL